MAPSAAYTRNEKIKAFIPILVILGSLICSCVTIFTKKDTKTGKKMVKTQGGVFSLVWSSIFATALLCLFVPAFLKAGRD